MCVTVLVCSATAVVDALGSAELVEGQICIQLPGFRAGQGEDSPTCHLPTTL